jgi:hypothetical protein
VNTNNTIYVATLDSTILVWDEGSTHPTKIINGSFTDPASLFVTSNGDIYIDHDLENGQVQKWIADNNTFVPVMYASSSCYGLFVDKNDTLYCSMGDDNQVVKRSMTDSMMTSTVVAAGTGTAGSALNELKEPTGIFVDVNFDLYVADRENSRVQLFQLGETSGITVAGRTSLYPTITLRYPTDIVLDAEKYLFIVDKGNFRIVGSGLNGFRCVVGCDGKGSQSNLLRDVWSFSFDRFGNMFVAEKSNNLIPKFRYLKKSCSKFNGNDRR